MHRNSQSNLSRNLNESGGLPPDQEDLLATWGQRLQNDGRAEKTVVNYVADVRAFLGWLRTSGGGGDPREVGSLTAQDYRDHLIGRWRPATVERALTALRAFYAWLGKPSSFARARLRAVREVDAGPRSLTQEEWLRLNRAAEARAEEDGCLALGVLRLMRYAGLRVGEVCALELPDLQCGRRKGSVRIRRGKGLKAREVPLVFEVCDALSDYLSHREALGERWRRKAELRSEDTPPWSRWPEGRVFLGERGPFTPSGIYRLLESLGRLAKVEKLHPHMLRHTFAKSLLDPKRYGSERDPLPLSALKQLLGHASLATTGVYLLHSQDDLEALLAGK